MRLPISWIAECVELSEDSAEISRVLTMAGLEVEEEEPSAIGPVLGIKVTPNRGDCLSVAGIARELGASLRRPVRFPSPAPSKAAMDLQRIRIEDDATAFCSRYIGWEIEQVESHPSPAWMQERLLAAGMRPIGGLVDVTNYVMLETGQPLHAFDLDKLAGGGIRVRTASAGDTLVTLDGVERSLAPGMLLICDHDRPVALAGIMGGLDTEVTPATKRALLESAHFDPVSVRRTSKRLDLRTEASYRFERGTDPEGAAAAAGRACNLVRELGIGLPAQLRFEHLARTFPPRSLPVRTERIGAMLGFEVSKSEVVESLTSLGFETDQDGVMARVPSWRSDIVREIDLVEEVGRVLGYDRIPERLPFAATTQGRDTRTAEFESAVRGVLLSAGLYEIAGHSLLAPSELDGPPCRRVAIRSALSSELSGLRSSLLPSLAEAADRNARRRLGPLAFFEIGQVFSADWGNTERRSVAFLLAGPVCEGGWQADERTKLADFSLAKGVADALLSLCGAEGTSFTRSRDPRLHPGRSAEIRIGESRLGWVGELHPSVASNLHTRHRIVACELDFNRLHALYLERPARFLPLPSFPSVMRDLAPRVGRDLPYASLAATIEDAGIADLVSVKLSDRFEGPPLPEGSASLTLSLEFRSPDRTLTDAEVATHLDRIRGLLADRCGAAFPG